jgi:ketosteroid isomerase-like protein
MQPGTISEKVRACYLAWVNNDRDLLASLLSENFTFSSPNDDHLNKAQYWEVCWPGSEQIQEINILNLVEQGDEAFARYECRLADGKRFKNTEYFKFDGGKIKAVEVYFGRNVETD